MLRGAEFGLRSAALRSARPLAGIVIPETIAPRTEARPENG